MERIVMVCEFTDGYTYFSEQTYPIMHLSTVDALFEFEKLNAAAEHDFTFCGHKFCKFADEELPDFYTIDEWFEKFCN